MLPLPSQCSGNVGRVAPDPVFNFGINDDASTPLLPVVTKLYLDAFGRHYGILARRPTPCLVEHNQGVRERFGEGRQKGRPSVVAAWIAIRMHESFKVDGPHVYCRR